MDFLFIREIIYELATLAYAGATLKIYSVENPMVIQQSMASGEPLVALDVDGVTYLIENGKTGFLLDCGYIESLVEKIMLFLSKKDLRRKFGISDKQY